MKKRKLNRKGKILVGCLYFLAFFLISCSLIGFISRPISKDKTNHLVVIEDGDTYSSIAHFLKSEKLIRSSLGYKIYIKINKPNGSLKAGRHYIRKNMSTKQIINELMISPNNDDITVITFKEGLNMRNIMALIATKTKYTQNDIINLLSDEKYLDGLIKKYWFLTADIKNKNIYYSLEGYLYPNTYEFNKTASLEDIFDKLLKETDKKLTPYKKDFEQSKYSIHEIITVASISELEAITPSDRENVSRIFYNRLDNNMSLGSDVTTYYAAKVNVGERDLYQSELNAANYYNTRSQTMAGMLPVGPICNPSITAIKTAINPKNNDYFYFVADKNRKVYFTKTSVEHDAIIKKLIKDDLWFTFD